MPSHHELEISIGRAFAARLWELNMAMLDHLDTDDEPSVQCQLPSLLGHFSTYATARRAFSTVLTEEFSPSNFTHQTIIGDYSRVLRWDVEKDVRFMRSLGEESGAIDGYAAAVLARWGSWRAVERRWPHRVPDPRSEISKAQVDQVCREIWTVIRCVGMTALVLGEGKPGDTAFPFTADGYGANEGGGADSSVSWGLRGSIIGWLGQGVGAGKFMKQD